MTTSLDGFDCSSLLMGFGRDVATFLSASSPAGLFRIDDHGWLGLTGEPGSADLNMAAVVGSASPGVVDAYVDAVEERGVDAILFVGDDAPHLVDAALARGLTAAGVVPMMVWRHDTLVSTRTRSARQVTENEISSANTVVAGAFSLDEDAVQRTMPPSLLAGGADVWIIEEDGTSSLPTARDRARRPGDGDGPLPRARCDDIHPRGDRSRPPSLRADRLRDGRLGTRVRDRGLDPVLGLAPKGAVGPDM